MHCKQGGAEWRCTASRALEAGGARRLLLLPLFTWLLSPLATTCRGLHAICVEILFDILFIWDLCTILYTMIFILDISMIFYSFWTFDTLFCASTDGAIYIAYIFTLNISSNAGHYVMWMRASSTTRTSMCPLMTRYTTFLHWTSSHITTRLYDIQRYAINMLCIESVLKQR